MTRFDFLHDPSPAPIELLTRARLPQRFYPAALVCAATVATLLAVTGFEALRAHRAQTLEDRAHARFERSRLALEGASLHWRQLDTLIALDRRLREVRLSGSNAAGRIARIGNSFPRGAWVTTLASGARSDGDLKGSADDLAAVTTTLANVARDASLGRLRVIRIARSETGRLEPLTFELRLGEEAR